MSSTDAKKGIILAFVGVLILSPDSLLVRLIDVPFYTLMFWRGLFIFLSLAVFLRFQRQQTVIQIIKKVDRPAFIVGLLFACSAFFFVASLIETSVAHTLIIVGASPVFTAIFSWIFLKELVQTRVWLAIFIIVASLFLVIQEPTENSTLVGDFYALLSSLIIGFTFVYVRKQKSADLVLGLSLSGLNIAIVAAFFSYDVLFNIQLIHILLLFILGTIVGTSFCLIALSARYIPAPVTSMFMPLETVIGVFLVWLVIGEEPTISSLIGGGLIISALVYISVYELKSMKQPTIKTANQ